MTVMQNLAVAPASRSEKLIGGLLQGRRRERGLLERAEGVLARLGLEDIRDTRYDELSGGELRLLEIGRHLMRDVDLMLLDEPTAGVTPPVQKRLAAAIEDLVASGMTVLLVEHNLGFVFGCAASVSVMVGGRVIYSGSPEDVQRHPEVIAAYLGTSEPS
jgi:ABC-type branched-subunit amino acid transport system ATPase component